MLRAGGGSPYFAAPVAAAPPEAQATFANPATLAYGEAAPPRTIDMQIENILLDRSAFEVGEQIFLSAALSRASYLYCFMASAQNTVIRLTPNSTNRSGWTPANHAVRIPDWMSPSPGFVMDAGSPGTEGVACFATDDDVTDRLPEALRGTAFKTIKDYPTLESVNVAFAQNLGAQNYTGNALYWQVVPRRTPPPAPAAAAAK